MSEQFIIDRLRELFKQLERREEKYQRERFVVFSSLWLLRVVFSRRRHLLMSIRIWSLSLPVARSLVELRCYSSKSLSKESLEIDCWLTLDRSIAHMLSNGSEFINWRLWWLFVSLSWPHPTQHELLELLFIYAQHDHDHSGFIFRSTYNEVDRRSSIFCSIAIFFLCSIPLAFSIDRPLTPEDPSQARPYEREYHLKQFRFDLFALDDRGILLPYGEMLLYVAVVPHPLHGLYRSLAIAERTSMPTSKEPFPHISMHCGSLHTQEYERLLDKEAENNSPSDGYVSADALYQVRSDSDGHLSPLRLFFEDFTS